MRKIRVLQFIVISAGIALGAPGKEITVCDLTSYKSIEGAQVSIRGHVGFTMHGAAFLDESCQKSPPGIALLYPDPGTANSPKVDFALDPKALDPLKPFFRTTGGSAVACGVLNGRLFYKKRFRLHQEGAGPQGNGFGPRGALRWALVIQSIGEIHACD